MVWFKEKGHSHGVVKVTENSHGVVFMPIKLSLNLKVLSKWLIILIFLLFCVSLTLLISKYLPLFPFICLNDCHSQRVRCAAVGIVLGSEWFSFTRLYLRQI